MYYIPIEKINSAYHPIDDSEKILIVNDLEADDYRQAFKRNFDMVLATVIINGATYTNSEILEPKKHIDDLCYIQVNEDGIPIQFLQSEDLSPNIDWIESCINDVKSSDYYYHNFYTTLDNNYITPYISISDHQSQFVDYKLISKFSKLMILGGPGSGKTSLMRKATYELLKKLKKNKRGLLPIYLRLRDLNFENSTIDITKYINLLYTNIDKHYSKTAEIEGRIILMFDGLDEIEHKYRPEFIKWMDNIILNKSSLRVVISSREITDLSNSSFKDFNVLRVEPFNFNQVEEYCHRMIPSIKARSHFFHIIYTNDHLRQLLSNPLLLSLSIGVFMNKNIFPNNISNLTQEIVNHLVEDWDINRSIRRYKNLNPSLTKSFLSKLSYFLQTNAKLSFGAYEVNHLLPYKISDFSIEDILREINENTGLINIHGTAWSFSHVYFQDFFCANYLIDKSSSLIDDYETFNANQKWINVWNQTIEYSSDPEFYINQDSQISKDQSMYLNRLITILRRSDYLDSALHGVVIEKLNELIKEYDKEIKEISYTENLINLKLKKSSSIKIDLLEEILNNLLIKSSINNAQPFYHKLDKNKSKFGDLIITLLQFQDNFYLKRDAKSIKIYKEDLNLHH